MKVSICGERFPVDCLESCEREEWGNRGLTPIDFVFQVKSTQQCGSIRNTKNLINYGYFLGRTVELKISVAVCSLRLIVESIGHMGRDTDAHWSIYITAQIISKQRPDLYQCKRE